MKFTHDQQSKIIDEVISYMLEGSTTENACKRAGVGSRTIRNWRSSNDEFADRFNQAKEEIRSRNKSKWVKMAQTGMELHLTYRKVTTTKREYEVKQGKKVLTKEIETESTVAPSVAVVIFALKNLMPEVFGEEPAVNQIFLGNPNDSAAKERNEKLIAERLKQLSKEASQEVKGVLAPEEQQEIIEKKFKRKKL